MNTNLLSLALLSTLKLSKTLFRKDDHRYLIPKCSLNAALHPDAPVALKHSRGGSEENFPGLLCRTNWQFKINLNAFCKIINVSQRVSFKLTFIVNVH